MGRWFLKLAVGVVIFLSNSAQAYVPMLDSRGTPIKWAGTPYLTFASNPSNRSGLSERDLFDLITHGLQRWQQASRGSVRFDYWQGGYGTGLEYNGQSNLFFASSNSTSAQYLSSNVLALTQVWYNTGNGEILEADMVLNDRDFQFSNDPRDTSTGFGRVYLGNVLTHEIGHAFGLSHSGAMESTMLFVEAPEQSRVSCDDIAGIRAIYPNGPNSSGTGQISGKVVSSSGSAVFGADVLAISAVRGTVMASALTDSSGEYRIGGLENEDYYLMVEPYYAGTSSLPSYYSSARANICSGGIRFGRSFLTQANSNQLQVINLNSGGVVRAPDLTAKCGATEGAQIPLINGGYSAASAIPVSVVGDTFAVSHRFDRVGTTQYFGVSHVSGNLKISALSFSLYSPMRVLLRLLDSNGNLVSDNDVNPVFQGESGWMNWDSSLSVTSLPMGDYVIEATSSYVPSGVYPAGYLAQDSNPFMVLTGAINPSANTSLYANNARCHETDGFGAYQSPGGGPPLSRAPTSTSAPQEEDKKFGFCGTISDQNGSGNDGPPDIGGLIGWSFPFLVMFFTQALRRMRNAVNLRET